MKIFFWFLFIGCILGGLVSSWLSPKLIGWYFEPPVDIGINCRPATEWAMSRLQWAQFLGSISGLILGLVLYLIWKRSPKNKSST